MSGHLRGVAARIQEIEPRVIMFHCLAHCTNLCLQSVGRQTLCIREALDLVKGINDLIRCSPKRSSLFESLRAQLSTSTPTLKPLCPTRWTVRTAAVNSILTNYSLLMESLDVIQQGLDEHATKATGFLNFMEKFSTFFGLKLSHLVFVAIEQLSITLQGQDTTLQEAIMASTLAKQFIGRQRTDNAFDHFYSSVVIESKEVTAEPVVPRQRRLPKRIDDGTSAHTFSTPKDYFRKQYFEVMDIISSELSN